MKNDILQTLTLVGEELGEEMRRKKVEEIGELQDSRSRTEQARESERQPTDPERPVDYSGFSTELLGFIKRGTDLQTSMQFLHTLRFREMEFRQSAIPEAHNATYQWLFAEQYHFIQWLRSPEKIFWISGKPGSGKSTLMKFISDHPQVHEALQAWSSSTGANGLITASFFFWISGTHMQKSQEGLLQSLLFQILKSRAHFIPSIFPSRWNHLKNKNFDPDSLPWTRRELLEGFKRLKNFDFSSTRFFFAIDGLDEYAGNHAEFLDVLSDLMDHLNVKICLSSRPWNIFEAAFGHHPKQKLYMEDFNKTDIRIYIKDKLEKRPEFQELAQEDTWAYKMTEEILMKSQGVFLWVYLVVRSLIDGLINCDRVADLKKRLRDFPSDLDAFFRQMFTSLDPTYRTLTARTFQVALASPVPLSLLNYWFLDCEEENPRFAIDMKMESLEAAAIQERERIMRKRINARCKGLLQFEARSSFSESHPSEFQVEFLHRTVRDFLMTEDLQKLILTWLASTFNPNLTACQTLLAEFKSRAACDIERSHGFNPEVFAMWLARAGPGIATILEDFMYHVRQVELRDNACPFALVYELERSVRELTQEKTPKLSAEMEVQLWKYIASPGCQSFQDYAARRSLALYLRSLSEARQDKRQIQSYFLQSLCIYNYRSQPVDTATIRFFLELGADPNYALKKYPKYTVWACFLSHVVDMQKHSMAWPEDLLYDCCRLLLDHGAERVKRVNVPTRYTDIRDLSDDTYRESYAIDVLKTILRPQLVSQLISRFPTVSTIENTIPTLENTISTTRSESRFSWLRRKLNRYRSSQ
jgi:hypothetical protein